MVYFIISSVLLLVAELYLFTKHDNDNPILTFLSIMGIVIATGLLFEASKSKYPEAIDVYRGKTTLKITYENNVPVDTVVVFKNRK